MARLFAGIGAGLGVSAAGWLWCMTKGKLTLDLGWGRSFHEVGPITLQIEAPRSLVFEQIASPYLGRTPKDARDHLEVWERGADMVVARHFSKVSFYTAETVEAVRFEEPERVVFRHLRGPVPHATEEFVLREDDGDAEVTHFEYRGELGIDFWFLGRLAGRYWVVPEWERQVRPHVEQLKETAEARSASRRRRNARKNNADAATTSTTSDRD
jgi:hypothetical protein